ncbi:MAG: molybdate ABC transporter substrate-binding protein [Verrucomicrobia bacterium]|nr:molybdate ABC transporter substrate-binding protein [Verrucomicrobiota bacterium]
MILPRLQFQPAITLVGLSLWGGICGCSPKETSLLVSAASSLTMPLQDQLNLHLSQSPAYRIRVNFGSSGALAQQIINGASVDLFLSANNKWIDEQDKRGLLLENGRSSFLGNFLVVITPKASTLTSFEAFLNNASKDLAVGTFESVPVGEYAHAWLENEGYLNRLENRLVFLKNEQQVLRAVENHHLEAGIIYQSSLTLSDKVRVLLIPDQDKYPRIRYTFAIPKSTRHEAEARNFLALLQSSEAKKIWVDNDFQVVD